MYKFTVIIYNRRRKSGKSNFTVSANIAYGQVKVETSGDVGGEYENPDELAKSGHGGGNEFPVCKPEAPVYATADAS